MIKIHQLHDEVVNEHSAVYPRGRYQAQCPKHGKWVTFAVSYIETANAYDPQMYLIQVAETEIPKKCAGCVEDANEVKLPPTRWPEDAEL